MTLPPELHTRGTALVVSRVIAQIKQTDVRFSDGRIGPRWFHDVLSPELQNHGLGFHRKKACMEDAWRCIQDAWAHASQA